MTCRRMSSPPSASRRPSGSQAPTGPALLQAATLALIEAQHGGAASIRSYSSAMQHRVNIRNSPSDEIAAALGRGDITAHF